MANPQNILDYCGSRKAATSDFPFDDEVLVFRVMNKMFALINVKELSFINLKCDPDYAIALRQKYPKWITPGYHMNKKLWNSVYFDGDLTDEFVYELIDHSWDLIVKSLKKADRELLEYKG